MGAKTRLLKNVIKILERKDANGSDGDGQMTTFLKLPYFFLAEKTCRSVIYHKQRYSSRIILPQKLVQKYYFAGSTTATKNGMIAFVLPCSCLPTIITNDWILRI